MQAGDEEAVAAVDRFFRNTLEVPCVPTPVRSGAPVRTAAADMPPPPRIPGPRPPPAGSNSQTPRAAWAPGAQPPVGRALTSLLSGCEGWASIRCAACPPAVCWAGKM